MPRSLIGNCYLIYKTSQKSFYTESQSEHFIRIFSNGDKENWDRPGWYYPSNFYFRFISGGFEISQRLLSRKEHAQQYAIDVFGSNNIGCYWALVSQQTFHSILDVEK